MKTEIRMIVTCRAPLAHGSFGGDTGNATGFRRMSVVGADGMPSVPVVSGNAFRGAMRRVVMRTLLDGAKLTRESVTESHGPAVWDRLYAAVVNGGHLESSETRVSPDEIRELRRALPPLSLFGSALYSWLLPGHMDVGILWPRCRETSEGRLTTTYSDVMAEDLVEEVSYVRHIEREEQDPDVSGVTPMPTTIEVLKTGTVLESIVSFAAHASPAERGAWIHGAMTLGKLGGKGSSGHGRVDVEIQGAAQEDIDAYGTWMQTDAPRVGLLALIDRISTSSAKAAKAAKAAAKAEEKKAAKKAKAEAPTP